MVIEFIQIWSVCHGGISPVEMANSMEHREYHNEKSTEFMIHKVLVQNNRAVCTTAASAAESSQEISRYCKYADGCQD